MFPHSLFQLAGNTAQRTRTAALATMFIQLSGGGRESNPPATLSAAHRF
jgi:hypothetical protein